MSPGMLGLCPPDLVRQTTLIISNEEMDDIIKIVKSLQIWFIDQWC